MYEWNNAFFYICNYFSYYTGNKPQIALFPNAAYIIRFL